MARITDQIESLHIELWSPDGKIGAALDGGRSLRLDISENDFEEYELTELERQLSALLTGLWEEFDRARLGVLKDAGCMEPEPGAKRSHQARELSVMRAESLYQGSSSGEAVTILSDGWKKFKVTLDSDSLDILSVEDFISQFAEAMNDLLIDYRVTVADMKREIYGWESV